MIRRVETKHLLNRDFDLFLREREDEKVERIQKKREKLDDRKQMLDEKDEEEKRVQRRLES